MDKNDKIFINITSVFATLSISILFLLYWENNIDIYFFYKICTKDLIAFSLYFICLIGISFCNVKFIFNKSAATSICNNLYNNLLLVLFTNISFGIICIFLLRTPKYIKLLGIESIFFDIILPFFTTISFIFIIETIFLYICKKNKRG